MSFTSQWGEKTGFQGKTLWDWLQLLIVPALLAGVALLFSVQSAQTQLRVAQDNQREAALQAYIDRMSEHILNDALRTSADAELRSVARTRTLSTLQQLDEAQRATHSVFAGVWLDQQCR